MLVKPPARLFLAELTKAGTTLHFDLDYRRLFRLPVAGSSIGASARTHRRLHFPNQWNVPAIVARLTKALAAGASIDASGLETVQTQYHARHAYVLGVGDRPVRRMTGGRTMDRFSDRWSP